MNPKPLVDRLSDVPTSELVDWLEDHELEVPPGFTRSCLIWILERNPSVLPSQYKPWPNHRRIITHHLPFHRISGRLIQQDYINGCVVWKDECALFIAGIALDVSESELLKVFEPYGAIVHVRYRPVSGGLGIARIVYDTSQMARAAIQAENGRVLHGTMLAISVGPVKREDVVYRQVITDGNGLILNQPAGAPFR